MKSTGRKIETITADLMKKEDVQRVAERLSNDSTITALVNNAGRPEQLEDVAIETPEALLHDLTMTYGPMGEIRGCMMGRCSLEICSKKSAVEETAQRLFRGLAT